MAVAMAPRRHVCELWVGGGCTHQAVRPQSGMGVRSREIGWISLPSPRASIPTKEREQDVATWAETAHESVYSNVPSVPSGALPMI